MKGYIETHRVAFVLLIVLIVVGMFSGCASVNNENANSSPQGTTVPIIVATNPTTESTTNPSTEPTTEPPATILPETTPPATEPQKETTPPATKPTAPTSSSTNNRKTLYGYDTTTGRTVWGEIVGEHAGYTDLENLVAWDGVSPLIFIYSDGTVGTEPIDGAQYESKPGILSTYVIYRDASGRVSGEICKFCSKEVEAFDHKPKNRVDYCTHYNFSSYCSYCGKWVESYDCHDCIDYFNGVHYCNACGKVSGDGANGTCLQYLMVDAECSHCGEIVPKLTCHTCNEG